MEGESLTAADDRVARVVAALEADDRGSPLGEQIGDLALALVAPLGADYDHARHCVDSDVCGRRVRRGQAGARGMTWPVCAAAAGSGGVGVRAVTAIATEQRHFVADLGQP